MSGLDHLRALIQGTRPIDDGLLGNARFSWGRSELMSEEAILASFAEHPFDLEGDILSVETPSGAVLMAGDCAVVADLYAGRIGRLWRIGGEIEQLSEEAIDVAFDADMRQERGALFFRAEDHPTLDPGAAGRLLFSAEDLIEKMRRDGNLRVRGFFVRAFGDTQSSAALLSLFTLDNKSSRSASFRYAVIGIGNEGDEVCVARDQSRPQGWTPRH